ncbi:MAG: hypothetical protein GY821_07385 [Gammaproteobacteria bacterium]|nr:hypothetical protein [Gammaproteobacteria bacterium]
MLQQLRQWRDENPGDCRRAIFCVIATSQLMASLYSLQKQKINHDDLSIGTNWDLYLRIINNMGNFTIMFNSLTKSLDESPAIAEAFSMGGLFFNWPLGKIAKLTTPIASGLTAAACYFKKYPPKYQCNNTPPLSNKISSFNSLINLSPDMGITTSSGQIRHNPQL